MLQSKDFPDTQPSLLRELREGGSEGRPAQSAWREFFECYAPAVFRVARRRGLDRHDAEDIVQQVMLSIAGHIGKFTYDRDCGRFRQWVKTISNNKIRDRHRRQTHTVPQVPLSNSASECVDEHPSMSELWEQEWRVQEILHCLDQVVDEFAPNRVQAFRLYVLEGVSAEETAQRMGMSRGHVYVTRSEILSRIRLRLQKK